MNFKKKIFIYLFIDIYLNSFFVAIYTNNFVKSFFRNFRKFWDTWTISGNIIDWYIGIIEAIVWLFYDFLLNFGTGKIIYIIKILNVEILNIIIVIL